MNSHPIKINCQQDLDQALSAGVYQHLHFKSGRYVITNTVDLTGCLWFCFQGGLEFIYFKDQGYIFTTSGRVTLGGFQTEQFNSYRAKITNQIDQLFYAHKSYCPVRLITFYGVAALPVGMELAGCNLETICYSTPPTTEYLIFPSGYQKTWSINTKVIKNKLD